MAGSALSELNKTMKKLKEEERITNENIESIFKEKNNLLLALDNLEKQRQEFPPGHNRMTQEFAQYCVEIVQKYREFCLAFARIKAKNPEKYRKEMEYIYKRHVGFFQRLKAIQEHINNLESASGSPGQNSDSETSDSQSENFTCSSSS